MNLQKGNQRSISQKAGPWWGLLLVLFLASCSVTEHLGPNDVLLKTDASFIKVATELPSDSLVPKIRFQNLKEFGLSTVDPSTLSSSVRTRPNKRMLLPKTYLHLYMLGKSLQTPLDSLMPATRGGRTTNGRLFNDLKVLSQSPSKTIAVLKYFDDRLFSRYPFIDSLGGLLENTIGEAPKLVNEAQLKLDLENLKKVYFSEGFFYAEDTFEVVPCKGRWGRQKAKVNFLVNEGKAAIIDQYIISRELIPNQAMYALLKMDSGKTRLKAGNLYKEKNMVAERARIVDLMRNWGYYSFSPQLVTFDVDTLPDPALVKGVKPNNFAVRNYGPVIVKVRIKDDVRQTFMGNISLNIDAAEYDPAQDTLVELLRSSMMTDSIRQVWGINERIYSDTNSVVFLGYPRVMKKLNFNFLENLMAIELKSPSQKDRSYRKGESYSLQVERNVQRRLQNLGIFKYVLVKHSLIDDTLDVRIEAQLLKKYQVKAGVEGFSKNDPFVSRNLPGFGAEVGLRDLMVFKGAERLDFSAAANVAFFKPGEAEQNKIFLEGNAGLSFYVPRFMIPFVGRLALKNLQTFSPNTSFQTEISREDSWSYTRNSVALNWNYNWVNGTDARIQNAQSSFSPYVITFVSSSLTPAFRQSISAIEDKNLRNLFALDFAPRFSSWGRYKFLSSNYLSSKVEPTGYFEGIVEMGGNTPYLIDRFSHLGRDTVQILGTSDVDFKDAKLGNLLYGQYFKMSLEGRVNIPLTKGSEFVMRGFIGGAQPWNYSRNVPLASRFFGGGVNGMRGWQSNTLGPGTYAPNLSDSTSDAFSNFLNIGGEFQAEFNMEYRANVNNWIELALFSDLGNVWFLPGSDLGLQGEEAAILSKNNYLELGWDLGLGVRLDFDFFIFRLDMAQQLYAPDLQSFVVKSFPRDLGGNRFQINFGIGYPF